MLNGKIPLVFFDYDLPGKIKYFKNDKDMCELNKILADEILKLQSLRNVRATTSEIIEPQETLENDI
jgi:hypothetical protein